jgi:phosphoglucosamine mutase
VGDRFVTETLKRGGFALGGEQSGHIIFGTDNNFTGDGTYTALRLVQAVVDSGRPFYELKKAMERFPQVLINVPVSRKAPIEELSAVREQIDGAQSLFGDDGRVLVRYSGTEMKLRVMTEGRDAALVRKSAKSIAEAVRAEIG